jgi:hypothetical protein
MICNVCGQDFGLAHNCAGIAPAVMPEDVAPRPEGFAPFYYLELAYKIARWDDVSIRRASRDPLAMVYGTLLWLISVAALYVSRVFRFLLVWNDLSRTTIHRILVGLVVGVAISAIITITQIGLCHLIAKLFLRGIGTFAGVLRPLLLAWFVNLLVLIPLAGPLAAMIAWSAVLMLVFEEVDGIGRVQAFIISYGINFGFFVLQAILVHNRAMHR